MEVDRRAILDGHESLTAAQATTVRMDVAIMGWAGQGIGDTPANHARCQQPMQSAPLMSLFHLFSPVTHPSSTLGSILLFHLRQGPKNPSPLSAGRSRRSRTVAQPAVSFTNPCWRVVAISDLDPAGGLESGVLGNRSCLVAQRLPVLRTPVESRRIWSHRKGLLDCCAYGHSPASTRTAPPQTNGSRRKPDARCACWSATDELPSLNLSADRVTLSQLETICELAPDPLSTALRD